jgi:hypothetical protein
MYRPTVRYDDCFKEYVEELFRATTLDRNQIMRLALFLLGHTKEGKDVLTFFSSSSLPVPLWDKNNMVLWYGKPCGFTFTAGERLEEKGVTSNESINQTSVSGPEGAATRRDDREVYHETEKKKTKYIARVGSGTTILYEG